MLIGCGVEAKESPSAESSLQTRGRYLTEVSFSSAFGATVCAHSPGLLVSSVMPFMPSLKPRRPSPRPLPSSGSFLPPKRTRATTAMTIRCVGVNSSPILFSLLPAGSTCAYRSLLSHKCGLVIDTRGGAKQMWAERYILVIEGNAGADVGRDVEKDVAIEDDGIADGGTDD